MASPSNRIPSVRIGSAASMAWLSVGPLNQASLSRVITARAGSSKKALGTRRQALGIRYGGYGRAFLAPSA
jgi:hypothetical protein